MQASGGRHEYQPKAVLRGSTSVASKDGPPIEFCSPAMGWLGPIGWVAEHLADLGSREHAVPDYWSTPADQPVRPRAQLRARFYHYAQQAICRVHGGWQSLPKSLDSLDVLRPAGLEE